MRLDMKTSIRKLFPDCSLVWRGDDGIQLELFEDYVSDCLTFDALSKLAKLCGTKNINIRHEDGTDWGGQTGRDSGKVIIEVRDIPAAKETP